MPIGGALYIPLFRPDLRPAPPFKEWTFFGDTVHVPEFSAPALGTEPNVGAIKAAEIPADANGVLYKFGGFSAASPASSKTASSVTSTTFTRSSGRRSVQRRSCRRARSRSKSRRIGVRADAAGSVERDAEGQRHTRRRRHRPRDLSGYAFTANECLDFGMALGYPVSLDYYDKAPFKFNGTIERAYVRYV